MGVHCYLTELGTLVTMAAKIVAVISTLASLAAAEPGYGGVALHPYGGSSSVYRTTQGLTGYGYGGYGGYGYGGYGYGKREAEPGYGAISYHGYGGYYGKRSADAEPGYATGYTYRTTQGLTGYGGYGYGGYGYGGYYGKRSAEPGYYGGASSFIHQSRPYYHGSYGYGYAHGGSSYQQVNRPYSAYGLSVAHPY